MITIIYVHRKQKHGNRREMEEKNMKKLTFPDNFWWGAASSGIQSEGAFFKQHKNLFDYWYEMDPNAFYDRVGPGVTSNFYYTYKEDIALMASLGLNSIRTSIQWSRLIDDFETASVNQDAVDFYNSVIDEFVKHNITLVLNLHHFDLPVELYHKYGGWESSHVTDLYVAYAKKAFALFGDRVKYWTTFNEPIVNIEGEYLYQFHYPLLVDGAKACTALYNINLSSAKAIQAFRNTECYKTGGKIGIVLNLTPAYPRNPEDKDDVKAAQFSDAFFNYSFLDPAVKGVFPKLLTDYLGQEGVLWPYSEEEMSTIKNNTVDFLGVNYYHPRRVQKRESQYTEQGFMPDKFFEEYDMPGKRMNPYRGWEIYPESVYDIAKIIQNKYGNIPWYIAENGMGVQNEERFINSEGMIEDEYRIEFYKEHLYYLHKAIEEGANCFGYHTWTPFDCWSFMNAYKNRYGLIAVDLKTQERTVKKSGHWMSEVVVNNGFMIDESLLKNK